MFEYKMKAPFLVIVFVLSNMGNSLFAQDQSPIDFIPSYKKGDRMVYQLVETKFRQNFNGFFYYLQYDTSYMVFNVTDKNDSQVLMDFNFADAIINGKSFNDPSTQSNFLKTETYKLVFTNKGEFVELSNWELFASILIQNIKLSYRNQTIDSNALKYYYLYYHDQEKVEYAVIPRVLELFNIAGDSYNLETTYSLAREIVNPFGGNNLQKSCMFKPYKEAKYPNSVFFAGKIRTNSEDNECLQDDYYAFLNEKKPDADSDIVPPYIYMEDTYTYQWGLVNHLFVNLTTTHTVYFGSDKQGLDRVFRFYAN